MNRRELFKVVGMGLAGVIVAPFLPKSDVVWSPVKVVSAADLAETYPPAGPWKMIAWREQEFTDELGRRPAWDDQIGFCGIFQDRETLELRRNAVRFDHHPEVTGRRSGVTDMRTGEGDGVGYWISTRRAAWAVFLWNLEQDTRAAQEQAAEQAKKHDAEEKARIAARLRVGDRVWVLSDSSMNVLGIHAWVRREGHPRVFGTVVDTQFNSHQERYAVRWEDPDCRLCQGEVVWVSRGDLNVVRTVKP